MIDKIMAFLGWFHRLGNGHYVSPRAFRWNCKETNTLLKEMVVNCTMVNYLWSQYETEDSHSVFPLELGNAGSNYYEIDFNHFPLCTRYFSTRVVLAVDSEIKITQTGYSVND